MKISFRTSTLFILAMLLCQSIAQPLVDNRASYCKDQNLDPVLLSQAQLKSERDHTYTDFYSNYQDLFNYLQYQTSNNFVKIFSYQFALYITLVLLIVISFIVFCFICCMCCKCNGKHLCWYECVWLFAIFFLCFVGLFAAVLVFIGISQNHSGPAYCTIFSVPAAVLYGNPGAYHKQEFIGYQPFVNFLGNYTTDVQNVGTLGPDALAISNANLPSKTQTSIDSILAFKNKYLNAKVEAGNGLSVVPDNIFQNPSSVTDEIETEFEGYDLLARQLSDGAIETTLLQNPAYRADAISNLNALNANMTNTLTNLTYLGNNFTDKAFKVQNWAIAGFWTFFGVSIVIIILALIAIILMCLMRDGKRQQCMNCAKVLLIIITFFVIIYGIAVLIMMAGIAGLSSFCKWTGDLNQGGWYAANLLQTYLGNDTGALIKGCFLKNGTGYIPDLVDSSPSADAAFNRLLLYMNGLNNYNNYITANPGFVNKVSSSLADEKITFTDTSNGLFDDNQHVGPALKTFNDENSCSNQSFDFTTTSCTANHKTNCNAIVANSYTPASCVQNGAIQTLAFQNLFKYISQEQTLLTQMSLDLDGTPKTSFANMVQSFSNIAPNANNMKNKFSNTLQTTSAFKNTLAQTTQCSNLQVEMLQFERYTCFPFTKPLYVLLILAFVSTLFLLFMVWAFYVAILHKEDTGQVIAVLQKPEFLAVSEAELVPRY